jgi:hypothetical protein
VRDTKFQTHTEEQSDKGQAKNIGITAANVYSMHAPMGAHPVFGLTGWISGLEASLLQFLTD